MDRKRGSITPMTISDGEAPSKSQSGGSNQFGLMLWKNWILKKRAPWDTLFEVLVPLFAFLILLAIRGAVSVDNVSESLNTQDRQEVVYSQGWYAINDLACGRGWGDDDRSPYQSISIAPDDNANVEFVKGLGDYLRNFYLSFVPEPPYNLVDCYNDKLETPANLTDFVLNDMIRIWNTSSELDDYYKAKGYGDNFDNPPIYIAILINSVGPKWQYTFRLNLSDTPWVGIYVNNLQIGYDSRTWAQYIQNYFLQVQTLVDQYIYLTQTNSTTYAPAAVWAAPFPMPEHKQDNFADYIAQVFGLFLVFAFMWPFSRMVRNLVAEKELKLREGMRMMGLQNSAFWLSWVFTYIVLFAIVILLSILITKPSLFPYSDFSVLFMFFFSFALSVISAACLVSSFFSSARTAGTLSPFVLLLGYFPFFGVDSDTTSAGSKGLACLASPAALALGGNNILSYEQAFIGARWDNVGEETDSFALITAITLMFFDSLVYAVLAWYLEKVWPTEFGVQWPWYFPFTWEYWSTWCCCPNSPRRIVEEKSPLLINSEAPVDYGPDYESVPRHLEEMGGVRIRGLRKEFPGEDGQPFVAVNGLNLDMYQGQIFVLLGHNGAGKTTTINMLTGMFPPTSGDAEVFGESITTDMQSIRNFMGVCPQHNVLYDHLTVKEHLVLFARLKGLPDNEVPALVQEAIEEVQLNEKTNLPSSTLSGGQKRRLSLAIALIGNSRIVYLDEPTSGVDPESRRAIWDLLAKKKQGRVIVLTTHFMDEADQLGDRIAILHKGKLRCCGSSLFLKRRFGVGYNLTLTIAQDVSEAGDAAHARRGAIQSLIKTHIPRADRISDVGAEVMFRLPLADSSSFPQMLDSIDQEKQKLGILNYGLSVTTLEEVFLKVAQDKVSTQDEAAADSNLIRSLSDRRESKSSFQKKELDYLDAEPQGSSWMRQFKALFAKRMHIAKRDKRGACCQYLVPIVLIALGLGILRIPPDTNFPTIYLEPVKFGNPSLIPVTDNFSSIVRNATIDPVTWETASADASANNTAFSQYLLDTHDKQKDSKYAGLYQDPTQPDLPLDQYNFTIYNNISAWHGLPTWLNMVNSALLRNGSGSSTPEISISTHPFGFTWRQQEYVNNFNGIFASIIISMGFVFIPASYGSFVVKEREEKSKHLQLISGVNFTAYWCANALFDFINYLIPGLICALIVLAYDNPVFTGENFPVLLLSFFLYGLSVIPFTYILTFFFSSHSTAQNVLIMVYLLSGVVLTMVNFALNIIPSTQEANKKYIRHLFRLLPNFCLGDSIFYLSIRGFLDWDALDMDVTGYDFVFMAVESIVYMLLALVIEKVTSTPALAALITRNYDINDPPTDTDRDVIAEKERVQSGAAENDLIQILGLRKVFPPAKVAVRDLWFGVPAGECFGYLGVNGAGKTTSIRMITGDEVPLKGTARLGGFDIVQDPIQVRKIMGYCPQFDALHAQLTARETLFFYGRIRGIPEHNLSLMVNYLIDRLSLTEYADRESGKYSGGNKRKLSVAIALVGNPRVVFLDEPSTGIDPVSRRFMWDFISETMLHRAVILTTHSMEECEALCTRIGIIGAGQLQCVGSSQHLKSRFGRGLQIDISTAGEDPIAARNFFRETFPTIQELEAYGGHLKYKLEETKLSLAEIFTIIEKNKDRVGVSEYSVGQTTLEQIFVDFARKTQPPDAPAI